MNRRSFIGGLLATAGALVLPSTVADAAEEVQRYHPLDRTMIPTGPIYRHEWGPSMQVTSGSFTLSFQGMTTEPIPYTAIPKGGLALTYDDLEYVLAGLFGEPRTTPLPADAQFRKVLEAEWKTDPS